MLWSVESCGNLAADRLASLPERWAHVRGVAAAAERIAAGGQVSDIVICAAWLHDVGYAESVKETGFHSLDGARMLKTMGAPAELAGLVAYHSGAEFEAEERNLSEELRVFLRPDQANLDALILTDMTVGPTGSPVSLQDRLTEILDRYSPAHPVHRAVLRSSGYLAACARRAQHRANPPGETRNYALPRLLA